MTPAEATVLAPPPVIGPNRVAWFEGLAAAIRADLAAQRRRLRDRGLGPAEIEDELRRVYRDWLTRWVGSVVDGDLAAAIMAATP